MLQSGRMIQEQPGRGVGWPRDAQGRPAPIVLPGGESFPVSLAPVPVESMTYSGGLLQSYSAGGVGYSLTYNVNGTLATVVSQGRTLTFTYNPDGTLAAALWS